MRLIKTIAILGALFGASSFTNTADAGEERCFIVDVTTTDGTFKWQGYGESHKVREAVEQAARQNYGFPYQSVRIASAGACSDGNRCCSTNDVVMDVGYVQ